MSKLRDFKGWDAIRTAIVATVVAMLVWVWAEGESVSRDRIPLRVSLDSDAASDYIYSAEQSSWSGTVMIDIEGTPASIAEARELARRELVLSYGLEGMPREPGVSKFVELSKAIPALSELRKVRVVVVGVDPRVLPVEVHKMVQRELPVKVELARTLVLDGEASASPSTVTVRLPDNLAARITDGIQPIAFVSADELDRVRGDAARTVNATVRLPASLGAIDPTLVEIRPEVVSVSLRVRKETDTFKLPAVPVWFSLPPTEDAGQWTIEILDKFVGDVVASGPADQIARIRAGDITVKALLELATDDLTKSMQPRSPTDPAATNGQTPPGSGTVSRSVIFLGLPPGVTAAAPNPIVRVRVTRNARALPPESGSP